MDRARTAGDARRDAVADPLDGQHLRAAERHQAHEAQAHRGGASEACLPAHEPAGDEAPQPAHREPAARGACLRTPRRAPRETRLRWRGRLHLPAAAQEPRARARGAQLPLSLGARGRGHREGAAGAGPHALLPAPYRHHVAFALWAGHRHADLGAQCKNECQHGRALLCVGAQWGNECGAVAKPSGTHGVRGLR
ncbi:unnamed protein product [Brugia timori]|uniref:Uncharacterized protein n=1 Tax=Brugia timori TaxID=42155 RepID=A0A3P7TCW7_9BILA|nr:unnamed protein product [Brugia timori]